MVEHIHTMTVEQSLEALNSNADYGLMHDEAALRLAKSGSSILRPDKKRPIFLRVFERFKDVYLVLLITVSAASAVFGSSLRDAAVIAVILVLIALTGIILSNRGNSALQELKKASSPETRVKREGRIISICANDVVAGDIVILGKGDCIPADIRIIESNYLKVDESAITGELEWAKKDTGAIGELNIFPGAKRNVAFKGSIVTNGRGAGVVFAIGKDTVIGRGTFIAADGDESETPLLSRLNTAAKTLGTLCVIICTIIFAAGVLYDVLDIGAARGIPELLMLVLALCTAAVPRGIAVMATAITAIYAQNMVKSSAAVKSLQTAENLGKTTVLCTKKTGLLTHNKMTITRVADPENTYEVTGIGYKAKGHVVAEIMITRNIALMSEIVVLCNDATYDRSYEQITGDPTEGAMLVFGAKLGHEKHVLEAARPRVHEIPFDSERKMMSTYNRDGDRVIMYTKGAAEEIINRSSYVYLDGEIVFMSDAVRVKLTAQSEGFAAQAMRVLACAYKVYDNESDIDDSEYDLIYVGMMALADPPNKEITASVRKCRSAGIDIKIMSGDHKNTVKAIAGVFGIAAGNDEAMDGSDIDALTDEELCEKIKTVNVFSRVTPEHKLRIITALKSEDSAAVAAVGNNPDDVLLLKKADIGMAMSITGTDIAKETADAIIADDSLINAVKAIEQGRTMYANIRKAVRYMLSCNFGVILLIFLAVVMGLPVPLSATQVLFISLLTGTLPALALGLERKESGHISKRPRSPEESILNRKVITSCITRAVFIMLAALIAFIYGLYVAVAPDEALQQVLAMSMCFFTMTACQLVMSYPSKTDVSMAASKTVFGNRLLNISVLFAMLILVAVMYVPGLNSLMTVIPLTAYQIVICSVLVLLTVLGLEVSKLYASK